MDEDAKMDLLRLSKRALALVSLNKLDVDLVFELRDVIRKIEKEMKGETHEPDEVR